MRQVGIWNGGATPSGILATEEGEWGRGLLSNTWLASLREMRYLSLKYKGLEWGGGGGAFNTTRCSLQGSTLLCFIIT